jgi:hypothetical protein
VDRTDNSAVVELEESGESIPDSASESDGFTTLNAALTGSLDESHHSMSIRSHRAGAT